MGVLTAAGRNAVLDQIEGLGWYYAPFNGDPSSTGTEVSGTTTEGRQAVNATLGSASSGSVASDAAVTWTATGAVTISHIALYDAASAGNLVGHTALTASKTLANTETLTLAIGEITITASDPA